MAKTMSGQDYISSLQSDVKAADFRANFACDWIAKIAPARKDIRILDVGCGLGQLILRLEEMGYTGLYGVDGSDAAIKHLNARIQRAHVQRIDIEKEKLPYANNHFDAVICMEVFEHLYNPVSVIHEISRVLRPGGHGIFSFPNEYRLTQRINFLLGRSISSPLRAGGHIKLFNRDLVVQFVNERMKILNINPVGNERVGKLPILTKIFPTLFSKWFFVLAQKPLP